MSMIRARWIRSTTRSGTTSITVMPVMTATPGGKKMIKQVLILGLLITGFLVAQESREVRVEGAESPPYEPKYG